MKITSYPINKPLKGTIILPGDKSISHRSIIISSIAMGKTKIVNLLESEDVHRTINALKKLGVKIYKKNNHTVVYGKGLNSLKKSKQKIFLGNSGTSARLLIGLLSNQNFNSLITGDQSLSKRPMKRIIDPINAMGGNIVSKKNLLPIAIKANKKMKPIKYRLKIPSAQIKSGILLASLNIKGNTIIIEPSLTRDHTEIMLKYFGANIKIRKINKNNIISIRGKKELKSSNIIIPGDFSSAAFFIVAALITKGSDITLKNININPTRTGMLKILLKMKANIKIKNRKVINGEKVGDIKVKYSILKGCKVSSKLAPIMIDEYPILSIAASNALGQSKFFGLKELKVKESNRLASIKNNLKKFNILTKVENDNLIIIPSKSKKKKPILIDSKKDHRIAMSFAIMGLVSSTKVIISDSKYINTSFPNFIKLLNKIGGKII